MVQGSSGWIRLYKNLLNNRKIGTLSDADFRLWVQLLLIASDASDAGALDDPDTVAYEARTTPERVSDGIATLCEKGLIDKVSGGPNGYRYVIHDWADWQYQASGSAERMRRHRERHRDGAVTSPRARASDQTRLEQTRPDQDARARASSIEPQKSGQKNEQQDDVELIQSVDEIQASDPLFERIWAGYLEFGDARSPRGKAEKLWRSLNPMVHDQVAEGLVVWALVEGQARKTDPDRKVKYLDTWLEAGLWEQYRPSSFPQFAPTAQRIVSRWLVDGRAVP